MAETRIDKQPAICVLLNNAVRVSFIVAPTRMSDSPLLEFTTDFRVLKVETSPFERSFDRHVEDDKDYFLMTEPKRTASFCPFAQDVLQQYTL